MAPMTGGARHRVLWIGAAVAVLVAALLIVLFGLGILALPSSPPGSLTVTRAQWTVVEGNTSSGFGWFGPREFNYSSAAQGFPVSVPAGGSLTLSWTFNNLDTSNHSIVGIVAASPFSTQSTRPSLPALVTAGYDGATIYVTVNAPDQSGASFVLYLTVEST